MAAVGITIPQFIWQVDFVGQLIDFPTSGMTNDVFGYRDTKELLESFVVSVPVALRLLLHLGKVDGLISSK